MKSLRNNKNNLNKTFLTLSLIIIVVFSALPTTTASLSLQSLQNNNSDNEPILWEKDLDSYLDLQGTSSITKVISTSDNGFFSILSLLLVGLK